MKAIDPPVLRRQSQKFVADLGTDWEDLAACRNTKRVSFFPQGSNADAAAVEAKRVCASCPMDAVIGCARTALRMNETYTVSGVWAGQYLGQGRSTRNEALEALRAIGGAEPQVSIRGGRPARKPAKCAGTCGRLVRPMGRTLEEFPGTLSSKRRNMCARCFRQYEKEQVAA